jgi:hypothetical protein
MTEETLPLAELLAKAGDGDFLRAVAEAVVQMLMEADVEGVIGAGRHERTGDRTTYRNGYRDRSLDTRLGSLQLRIPKLRQGWSRQRQRAASFRSASATRRGCSGGRVCTSSTERSAYEWIMPMNPARACRPRSFPSWTSPLRWF